MLEADHAHQPSSQCSSDERAEDRHDRIAPVGRSLSGDWQESVGQARSKVARWIDGITGGSSERKANAPHQRGDQVRTQARSEAGSGDRLGENSSDDEDQY